MPKVSVITGGAGDMGLATAKVVGRDHFVVLSDVRRDRLDTAVRELESLGISCAAVPCDITDTGSVAQLVEESSAHGQVASVIHTAGISPSMGSAELIMKVNALGTVRVNEAFYPIAADDFAIVNVASNSAYMLPRIMVPVRRFEHALSDQETLVKKMMAACRVAPEKHRPGMAYAISKSFVRWYSASQAARFGRTGARLLSVSPGSFDTEMGRLEENAGSGAMIEYAALKRFGKPQEIAEVLAFCAGEKASYLTGVDILCDGGVVGSMSLRDKLALTHNP